MSENFAQDQFLEDYVEEASQLLHQVVKQLLELGSPMPSAQQALLYQDMLRSFHTLKGLSGMVGLDGVAQLSHSLESILNRLRKNAWQINEGLLESMLDGARAILQVVECCAAGNPIPDLSAFSQRMKTLLQDDAGEVTTASKREQKSLLLDRVPAELLPHLTPDERARLASAAEAGKGIAILVFIPTPKNAAEGLNVSTVRERLQQFGEIVKAIPLISGKTVRFAFVMLFETGQEPPEISGLSFQDLTPPSAVPTQAVENDEPSFEEQTTSFQRLASVSVRVEVSRLDEIMRLVGDLVVSRWGLQNALDGNSVGVRDAVQDSAIKIERQLRELREAVMRARLVPLSEVFGRMPLAVRDLARSSGRQVRLLLIGEDTQLDKVLIERLLDPLLHLVRNAIAHGIESPEDRVRAGKEPTGTLILRGHPEGDSIRVQIQDDGKGLDLAEIETQARSRGWLETGHGIDSSQALDLICRPGFSTRNEPGMDAGRGMGMDVVRRSLAEMGGSLSVVSEAGKGCSFTLRLPLTLAIIDCFLVKIGSECYAVARDSVTEVVEVEPAQITRLPHGELLPWRGASIPLQRLRDLLKLSRPRPENAYQTVHALVFDGDGSKIGFVVDQVIGLREVVVRAVSDPLVAHPWLGGATELGDGTMALILDLTQLFHLAVEQGTCRPAGKAVR